MNILGTAFISIVVLNACLAFYLQVNKVEVFPGESVLLPCNSSGFPTDELHWEAMGKHVAVLREGHITAGQGYEDRVFLEDPTASDDFSLVLRDVVFSDGGIYECLWRGQKPVCSVFVNVLESLNFPVLAAVGEDVTLHCFGNVPSNNPWEDIDIHWLKDEREVLRFTSGKIDVNVDNSHMSLPVREEMSRGIFSLSIRSIRAQDQGVYQCRYKSTDHEDLQNGLPETRKLILLDVSSDVPSTSESILSTSSGSYTQTSTSVPTWKSVASTEWSTEISTSAQTSADTVEVVSSEMSSTVESVPNTSNTSYTQTSTSVPTRTDVTSTEWSSPVSTHSFVELTDIEDSSTASAQTSADTVEVVSSEMSSTIESVPNASNTSYTQTSTSVPTRTDVTSTEWSSPVSTHSYVEQTHTEDSSTASAQTSADTVEVVSSEMSSTVESVPNASSSSWAHVASIESFSPVSHVERSETGDIRTTSAQTSAEEITDVSPVLGDGTSSGQYGSLELLSDEKIPWILVGLISGVLLITAGVLTSLMLFARNRFLLRKTESS